MHIKRELDLDRDSMIYTTLFHVNVSCVAEVGYLNYYHLFSYPPLTVDTTWSYFPCNLWMVIVFSLLVSLKRRSATLICFIIFIFPSWILITWYVYISNVFFTKSKPVHHFVVRLELILKLKCNYASVKTKYFVPLR